MKNNEEARDNQSVRSEDQPYQVRLPGFIIDNEIGLGDVIKRATAAVGIRPCGGCVRRASTLNRWIVFTGRGPM
jgi:hypothetical protein